MVVKKRLTDKAAEKAVDGVCNIYGPWLRREDKSFHDVWWRLTRGIYLSTKPKVMIPDTSKEPIWNEIVDFVRSSLNSIVGDVFNQDGDAYELTGDFLPSNEWSVFKIIDHIITQLLAAVHRDLLKMADKDITIDRQAVESLTTDLNGTYLDKLAALENCGVHITVGQVIKIQDEIAEWIREVLLGLLKTTFHEQHISRDDTIAPCSGTSILVDPNQTQSTNVDDSADAVDDTTMEDATAVEDTTTEDATAAEQTNDVDKSTVFDASATAGPSTDKPATNPVSSLRIDTEDWSKICNAPYLLYSEGKTKACKECNIILPAYKFFYSHADFWELSCQDKCPKCAASCTEYGMAEFAFRFMHHQDGLFGWYGLMDDATLEPDATARKRHKQQYDREYSKRFKKWKRYHYWKTVDEEQRKVYDNEEGKKEEKSTGTLRPSDLAANDHSKGKRKATK